MDRTIAVKLNDTDEIIGYLKLKSTYSGTPCLNDQSNAFSIAFERQEPKEEDETIQQNNITIEMIAKEEITASDVIDFTFKINYGSEMRSQLASLLNENNNMNALISEKDEKLKELAELRSKLETFNEMQETLKTMKADFDQVCEQLVDKDSQIEMLEENIRQLNMNNQSTSHVDEINDLKKEIQELSTDNWDLKEQVAKCYETINELTNSKLKESSDEQNDALVELQQLKEKLLATEQDLQEAGDKASKTSVILAQSLEKFKSKESALQKSLEELEEVKQLCNQQSVEISELRRQLDDNLQNMKDNEKDTTKVQDIGQMDEEQKDIFANMVQASLDKLKLVSKILNSKNSKPGVISSSIEKVKTSVIEKRNEEDKLAEFEKKLKTHFWNIHEVYLSILTKQTKKNESHYEELDQMKTQSSRSTHKLNYIGDLINKFIHLESKDKIHKDILVAIVDVFTNKPEDKATFFKNLKCISL